MSTLGNGLIKKIMCVKGCRILGSKFFRFLVSPLYSQHQLSPLGTQPGMGFPSPIPFVQEGWNGRHPEHSFLLRVLEISQKWRTANSPTTPRPRTLTRCSNFNGTDGPPSNILIACSTSLATPSNVKRQLFWSPWTTPTTHKVGPSGYRVMPSYMLTANMAADNHKQWPCQCQSLQLLCILAGSQFFEVLTTYQEMSGGWQDRSVFQRLHAPTSSCWLTLQQWPVFWKHIVGHGI